MEENNKDGSIGVVGCELLDVELSPATSCGEFPTIRGELNYLTKKVKEKIFLNNNQRNVNSLKNVDYIIGADLFIPRYVFKEIGGFDPDFFMYYEETDLQKRMANNGLQRLIIQGPKIIHLEGGSISSSSKFSYARFELSQKSLHVYMHKHFKGLDYVFFRFFIIVVRLGIILDSRFNFIEKIKVLKLIISGKKR